MSKKEAAQASLDVKARVTIREYLIAQNRPYSVVDVHTNLRGEYNKPTVQRVLEQLADAKEIKEKVIGKQKIYYPDQDQMPAADEGEMKAVDEARKKEQTMLTEVTATLKMLEKELKEMAGIKTLEELRTAVDKGNTTFAANATKLAALQSSSQPAVTQTEVDAVDKARTSAVHAWRKRKRIADEMVNTVLENCSKKRKELHNDMGIDTDEEANVKLP